MKKNCGLFLLSSLLFISCKQEVERVESAKIVKCEVAQTSSAHEVLSQLSGKIVPSSDVNLSFRVAGVLSSVAVKEGDYVKKGEIIALMDSRDYLLQLQATQAEYDAVKGEVDRIAQLYNEKSVSENDYQKAINGLKRLESKLESHKNSVADTRLVAPFNGYVQQIKHNYPEAVSAGMAIVSFISSDTPELLVNLPSVDFIRREQLSAAAVQFETVSSDYFNLKLIGINKKANLNQLHQARFSIEPSSSASMPPMGISGIVTLSFTSYNSNGVLLPFSAIVERNNSSYVWIVKDGVVALKPVEVAEIKSCGKALVSRGVASQDSVVVAGVNSIEEGERVVALPAPSATNIGNML